MSWCVVNGSYFPLKMLTNMMLNVELFYRDLIKFNLPLTDENHDQLKSKFKNISYSYIYSFDFSKQKNILSKDE